MQPIKIIRSRYVTLPIDNVDTDQIIPARFLKVTTRHGLGKHAFEDWRYNADGSPKPDFILNKPEARGAAILVAGDNFGCGSSREHAPWALLDCGLQVVISARIADIFRNNSLKNGLLPVVLPADVVQQLLSTSGELTVDLEKSAVTLPSGQAAPFQIDPFARYRLLNGMDELDFLLHQQDAIAAYEAAH